jgi:uncharacterized Zn finger protein (UPF0148 family)
VPERYDRTDKTEADIRQDGTVICPHCKKVVQLGAVGLMTL